MPTVSLSDLYSRIAKGALGGHSSEEDALALMLLLHTHRIRLAGMVLEDRPGVTDLAAITQRHAAELLATAWPDNADAQRSDPRYWYYQFNARTPFEVVEDIPHDWMVRVERIRRTVTTLEEVRSLEPED